MKNDIIAIASVGLELGITASSSDGACAFGLSLTFRIDIIIFASLPATPKTSVLPVSAQKSLFEVDTGAYLRKKALQLKDFYSGWETYLKDYQSRIAGTVFKSLEDVESKMKEIVLEQVRVRAGIEQMIKEVDSELKTRKLDIKNTNAVLKFLSNCYQIIRDLSVTFVLGQKTLIMSMEPSEDAEAIRSELLKKYARYGVIKTIKKRRDLSETILANEQEISDLKNKCIDDEEAMLAVKEKMSVVSQKIKCKKKTLPLIEEAVDEWNALEMGSLKRRIAILDQEIAFYEKEITALSADKKEKVQLVANEIKGFLKKTQQEKSALEEKFSNARYSATKAQVAYIGKDEEMNDIELSKIKRRTSASKGKITKLEIKIGELLSEYEEIAKELV